MILHFKPFEPGDYAGNFPPPRAFQKTANTSVRKGRKAGHRVQMLMAPTGAGKSYLGLQFCQQTLAKGNSAMFLCDRTTLIRQTSAAADAYGLPHGIIQADNPRTDPRFPFQIASPQTLASRGWPAKPPDVVVIDEAHTQLSVWLDYIKRSQATFVGLSATPFSKGLGKTFTNLISAATMDELTRDGVLVPLRVISATTPDMEGALTSDGEWTPEAAAARGVEIVGDVVTEWIKYGEDRKTICFGANVAHCEELANQFVKAGIMAALFTGHTPENERADILAEFDELDGPLKVLISVEALAKGFDKPYVSCIIDCRPLRKSLSTFIQIVGRGLRSFLGKLDCILLDHSGNIVRFAKDYTDIFFNGLLTLDDGERMDSEVRKEPDPSQKDSRCPRCGFKPFFKRCMKCGFEVEAVPVTEHKPGQMTELKLTPQQSLVDRHQLYQQLVAYAKAHSKPEKQKGRAAGLFKEMTGEWPPNGWKFDRQVDVPVPRELVGKITHLNIKRNKTPKKETT